MKKQTQSGPFPVATRNALYEKKKNKRSSPAYVARERATKANCAHVHLYNYITAKLQVQAGRHWRGRGLRGLPAGVDGLFKVLNKQARCIRSPMARKFVRECCTGCWKLSVAKLAPVWLERCTFTRFCPFSNMAMIFNDTIQPRRCTSCTLKCLLSFIN